MMVTMIPFHDLLTSPPRRPTIAVDCYIGDFKMSGPVPTTTVSRFLL